MKREEETWRERRRTDEEEKIERWMKRRRREGEGKKVREKDFKPHHMVHEKPCIIHCTHIQCTCT